MVPVVLCEGVKSGRIALAHGNAFAWKDILTFVFKTGIVRFGVKGQWGSIQWLFCSAGVLMQAHFSYVIICASFMWFYFVSYLTWHFHFCYSISCMPARLWVLFNGSTARFLDRLQQVTFSWEEGGKSFFSVGHFATSTSWLWQYFLV